MPRYIDADKAKEKFIPINPICRSVRQTIDEIPTEYVVPRSEVERLITLNSQLEAKLFEERKAKVDWISVEERLPEKSGEYLTWHNGYFGVIEYNADLHGWNIMHHADRSTEIKSVTHWMPLPEPPEKREPDCRDCRYFVGCECFSGTPCCDLSKAENRKDDEKDG